MRLSRASLAYLRALETRPGACTRELAHALGVDDSTADYHLRRLQKAGLVVRLRPGKRTAHYPNGQQGKPAGVIA